MQDECTRIITIQHFPVMLIGNSECYGTSNAIGNTETWLQEDGLSSL